RRTCRSRTGTAEPGRFGGCGRCRPRSRPRRSATTPPRAGCRDTGAAGACARSATGTRQGGPPRSASGLEGRSESRLNNIKRVSLYSLAMRIIDFHNHYYPPEYLDALGPLGSCLVIKHDQAGNPVVHYPGDYNVMVRGHRDIAYRQTVLDEQKVD